MRLWLCCVLSLLRFGTAQALVTDTVQKVDTLYPSKENDVGDPVWFPQGVTVSYDCVDDYQIHDTSTTYLKASVKGDESFILFSGPTAWQPQGLVGIDSVYFHAWAMKNAGTAGKICFIVRDGDGTATSFDTTLTLNGGTYQEYEGNENTNPSTSAAWTVDSINNLSWGIDLTTAASLTKYVAVTQLYMEVFWQQRVRMDTITEQTEIFDNYMRSSSPTYNYGGSATCLIGNLSGSTNRMLLWVDTAFYTNWGEYYIDSAYLDLKTETMRGGTHNIVTSRGRIGTMAGTATGSAQSAASCWADASYDADMPLVWGQAGADSAEVLGGTDIYDDIEFDDTVAMSADETVYPIDVTAWCNEQASIDWVRDYPYWTNFANCPWSLRLRQLSEDAADSQIAIHSMNDATAGDRPRIRLFGHWRYVDSTYSNPLGVHARPFGVWDTVYNYTRSGAGSVGGFYSVSLRSHAGDTNSIGMWNNMGVSWGGLEVSTTVNSNDWVDGSYLGTIWWWPGIYDTLMDNCMGIVQTDTQFIQSVVLEWNVATKNGTTVNTLRGKLQGPVLWHPRAPNRMDSAIIQWKTVNDSASTFDEVTIRGSGDLDTIQWRTDGCLYDSANILGDDPAQYEQKISGGADSLTRWDLGKYATGEGSGVLAGHASPYIVDPNGMTAGTRYTIDITDMFKTGFAALAKTGGSTVRGLGFGVLLNWVGSAATTRDSINTTYNNTTIRLTGNASNGTSAAIRIILKTNLDAFCTDRQTGMFGKPGYRRAGDTPGALRVTGKKGERRIRP